MWPHTHTYTHTQRTFQYPSAGKSLSPISTLIYQMIHLQHELQQNKLKWEKNIQLSCQSICQVSNKAELDSNVRNEICSQCQTVHTQFPSNRFLSSLSISLSHWARIKNSFRKNFYCFYVPLSPKVSLRKIAVQETTEIMILFRRSTLHSPCLPKIKNSPNLPDLFSSA